MDTLSVLLVGHSLLIDGVAACLHGRRGVCMARIDGDDGNLETHLQSNRPEFVIFEWNATRVRHLLGLLVDHPGTQLVGIDLEHRFLFVLSGRRHSLVTMQDLVATLENAQPKLAIATNVV